jgi:nitrate reductase gamma subunit
VLLVAGGYLFLRRVFNQQVRYISLAADYFPLFLIIGVTLSGILMRYFIKVDIVKVKELTMGLATLKASVPEGIGVIFFIHLFLISVLFAYFPFSKLMHLGGIFFSPTRNLANNSREVRHVNPWNPKVKLHTYEEYEDEFRELMKEEGIPVEKE